MRNVESEFIKNGGEFREVNLSEIFTIERGTRFIKSKRQKGEFALATAGELNQGVAEFIAYNDELKLYENHLTIDMFCNCFYRPYKFMCDDNILVLFPLNENLNGKMLLYIASIINLSKSQFGYGKQYRQKSFLEHKINLPFQNGEIDFDFMENFISELEKERVCELETEHIRELEAYLKAADLKDYELTQNEKDALAKFDDFSKWGGVASEFKIGDLFYVKSNPQLNKDSFKFSDNAEYPYFTRTVLNNGIAGYVDYLDDEHKITGNSLAVGMLGMQFFYMQKDFYAGQFTKTIYPKFENFNSVIAQYFITWLNKNQEIYQSGLVRDFENLFNNTKISLLTKNNAPDYEFMSDFIRAVQKLVIKDVVLWSEKKIEATKSVI
ncbi:restriction endonuclease subunit S [Campylobacter gastrosuis]|uniref:Restriction endonuclease subunit S n=1 Tax=Campylobacter gastrosuis TaxID=2974576 RepID=A0ABT7HQK1_9BACT|nr:restriction endonuclease subunit S [Campylobacter gastrosuis]MDL0088893.1 restriction endonuclease subunit S [Campylobacter gastrosuis]